MDELRLSEDDDPAFWEEGADSHKRQREALVRDMAAVAAMPEGRRVLAWLLRSLGLGRHLAPDAWEVGRYNFALETCALIADASPEQARRILACVHGLEPLDG